MCVSVWDAFVRSLLKNVFLDWKLVFWLLPDLGKWIFVWFCFVFFFLVWFFYLHQAHHQRLNHNRTVSATTVFLSNLTNKKSSDICLWWWEQNLIRKQMALCGFQEFLINKLILKEVCKKKPKSNNTLVVCIFFWNWVYTLLNINIKA